MHRKIFVIFWFTSIVARLAFDDSLKQTHTFQRQFELKPSCIDEGFTQKLNKQQQINKMLTQLYSLGKIPGNCSQIGITKQEKQRFLINAKQIKDKILTTEALLQEKEEMKQTAQELDAFKHTFLKCLNIIDPNFTVFKQSEINKISADIKNSSTSSNTSSVDSIKIKQQSFVTNPLAHKIIVDNRNLISKQEFQRFNNSKVYRSCPINLPYFNGSNCITCKNYFNANTKQCMNCPENTKYDKNTFKCVKVIYITNLYAKNILVHNKTIKQQRLFQKAIKKINSKFVVKCHLNKPFAQNYECRSCSDQYPLFDLQKYVCTKCPINNIYDSKKRQCVQNVSTKLNQTATPNILPIPQIVNISQPSKQNYISKSQDKFLINPDTYGLILDNISLQDYISKYNILRNNPSGGILDCPSSQPYYNGKECIVCPVNDSKFRISDLKCTHCPDGTFYLYKQKKCIKS